MIEMHQADSEKYEADAAALRTLAGASLEDTAGAGKRASIKAIDVIAMQQADIQFGAGQLQRIGMINLGVVDIQFRGRAVMSPSSQQRIDEHVEILAEIVPRFHEIATMAIDPSRQSRLDRVPFVEHHRTVFEISQPKRVTMVARPAATNLLRDDPQLDACRALPPKMVVQR